MKKSSKTNSTTHQTSDLTSTPINPAWVDSGLQGLAGKIGALGNQDPYSFVAGVNPLQAQAGQTAAGLTGTPWNFDQAASALRGVANGSVLDNLSSYISPYTNNVVNASLAGFDDSAGRTRAQQALDVAGDTTFGGSGGSILKSLTEGQLGLSRGQLESGLRDQAFQRGSTLALNDLAQKIQAAQALAATSSAFGNEQRANAATQAGIGDQLRQIEGAQRAAPVSLLGTETGLFGGLPLGLLHGENQRGVLDATTNSKTTVSDPLGSIGGLLGGLGSLAGGFGALGQAGGFKSLFG